MSLKPSLEDEYRDLGFGSIVARESRQRLLNQDGSFNVARKGLKFWASLSLYHSMLTIRWWKFLSIMVSSYLLLNMLFAVGYLLCGPGALEGPGMAHLTQGNVWAFFFSVQTFSTIGYGHISPVGLSANILVTFESLVGLLWLALTAGLLFARFSRPIAKILFSKIAVIAPYRGITAFEFRIANSRSNQLIEVEVQVLFSRLEKDGERRVRRFYPLSLEREKVVFFPLSWTIVHPISEDSPLFGLRHQDLCDIDAEFLILLTAIDETFSQNVHARSSYKADEIVCGAKFTGIFNIPSNHEPLTVDLSKIHDIEPVDFNR